MCMRVAKRGPGSNMPAQSVYHTLCDKSTARLVNLFDCCSKVAADNEANDSDAAVNDGDDDHDDREGDAIIGDATAASTAAAAGTVVKMFTDSVGKRLAYYGACPCNGRPSE